MGTMVWWDSDDDTVEERLNEFIKSRDDPFEQQVLQIIREMCKTNPEERCTIRNILDLEMFGTSPYKEHEKAIKNGEFTILNAIDLGLITDKVSLASRELLGLEVENRRRRLAKHPISELCHLTNQNEEI